MKPGISSHTYAWAIGVPGSPPPRAPLDAFGLLQKAVALNVPVVQIADNLPLACLSEADLRGLKAAADEQGVQIEVGTAGIDRDQLLNYLEIARTVGSPIVRTLLDSKDRHPSVTECVVALRAVARDFEQAGVSLAIENHDRFRSRTLAEIITSVGSPNVGICLDTANSLGCGEDVRTVTSNLAPFVINLHIKDVTAHRLPHCKGFVVEGASAGTGQLDIPDILSALGDRSDLMSVIVELWLSPDDDIEQTILREDRWATDSVAYVRQCLETASERRRP